MSVHATTPARRRGACPGLSTPMATGDGLLVRLTPIGTIPFAAFAALAAAARRHGNGIVEVTARGNIQVRGLSPASAPCFAAAVAALDIAAADGIPILTDPLAGLDPTAILDAGALAADLRRTRAAGALRPKLAAKVSVAIDGGGACGLDSIAADIRLCAVATADGPAWRVAVGGDAANASALGMVAVSDGVPSVVRLLEILAACGRHVRARDVIAAGNVALFRSAVADLVAGAAPPQAAPRTGEAIGLHRLRDGTFACGLGLAFGHADAAALQNLTDAATAAGAAGMRAAPGRALMIIGLARAAVAAFAAAAESLGCVVRSDDPRRHVVACAGAPFCASAHIATRAMAPRIAALAAAHVGASGKIHLSGCAKGCAHPAPAALTIVGTPTGCAIVADGSARDVPFAVLPAADLPTLIGKPTRQWAREAGHV